MDVTGCDSEPEKCPSEYNVQVQRIQKELEDYATRRVTTTGALGQGLVRKRYQCIWNIEISRSNQVAHADF